MTGKLKELLRLLDGEWIISFTTRDDPRKWFGKLKDDPVSIEIKKLNKKRSLSANDFCWAMCTDIGKALTPPLSKEEVYRRAIKAVGSYEPMLVEEDKVDAWSRIWSSGRVGWFIEVIDDSREYPGCKIVHAYYGTSIYDTKEMSLILNYLKDEMEQMELQIPMSKKEEERVLAQWSKA